MLITNVSRTTLHYNIYISGYRMNDIFNLILFIEWFTTSNLVVDFRVSLFDCVCTIRRSRKYHTVINRIIEVQC